MRLQTEATRRLKQEAPDFRQSSPHKAGGLSSRRNASLALSCGLSYHTHALTRMDALIAAIPEMIL